MKKIIILFLAIFLATFTLLFIPQDISTVAEETVSVCSAGHDQSISLFYWDNGNLCVRVGGTDLRVYPRWTYLLLIEVLFFVLVFASIKIFARIKSQDKK